MSTVKSITLSHSSAGYDSYEKLNQIFVKGNKERVESYIKNLTKEYASDEKYISKDITCKSLFRVGDDIVLLEAYPQRDTRFFVECQGGDCQGTVAKEQV